MPRKAKPVKKWMLKLRASSRGPRLIGSAHPTRRELIHHTFGDPANWPAFKDVYRVVRVTVTEDTNGR